MAGMDAACRDGSPLCKIIRVVDGRAGEEHIVPRQRPADRLDLPRIQLRRGLPGLQTRGG